MPCSIASVTSYLSENESKSLQNGDVHIAQIPDFEMEYLRTICALRSVMARFFFFIFHALSFELNFFFDLRFPFKQDLVKDQLFHLNEPFQLKNRRDKI